jgi:hypothetical protein
MYLDAVRLDSDEAGKWVSQWVSCGIGLWGFLRLLVGRHCDCICWLDRKIVGTGTAGKKCCVGLRGPGGDIGLLALCFVPASFSTCDWPKLDELGV